MKPSFKLIIDQLGENCNDITTKKMYRLLIDYFDTHLIIGVTMGGSIQQRVFFKQELLKTIKFDPGVLQYDIIPISQLFKNPLKQKCMDNAINEYLKEMDETTKY